MMKVPSTNAHMSVNISLDFTDCRLHDMLTQLVPKICNKAFGPFISTPPDIRPFFKEIPSFCN
jgi:hypothetical protein